MTGFFDYDGAQPGEAAPDDLDVVLSGLDEQDWNQIHKHAEIRRYAPGDVVIEEGDTNRDLFIVLSGEVSASLRLGRLGTRRTRTPMRAGAVFGEVGFFAGGRRTASIVAESDTELLRLHFEQFQHLAAQDPALAQRIVFDLGRVLAGRLLRAERSGGR